LKSSTSSNRKTSDQHREACVRDLPQAYQPVGSAVVNLKEKDQGQDQEKKKLREKLLEWPEKKLKARNTVDPYQIIHHRPTINKT